MVPDPDEGKDQPTTKGTETERAEPESSSFTVGDALVEQDGQETERRTVVAEPTPSVTPPVEGAKILQLELEGISPTDAKLAMVRLTALNERGRPVMGVQESWVGQGVKSEFSLDSFFRQIENRRDGVAIKQMELLVDHPRHFSEKTRVSLSSATKLSDSTVVYKTRVELRGVVYWPEFLLSVRDARTREHLNDVEIRIVPTAFMGLTQQPGEDNPFTQVGQGLQSPVALRGARKSGERKDYAAGVALSSATGDWLRPAELMMPEENARGIMAYARSPGYAWGRIVLDVSKASERELLLEPSASLHVWFSNLQLESYRLLDKEATFCVIRVGPDGGKSGVHYQELGEVHQNDGLRIDGLEPGKHMISVELGPAFSWRKRHVLVREELELVAGETHQRVLTLSDSPQPKVRETLAGTISFPSFGGEEEVLLRLYASDYQYGEADFELSMANMVRVDGSLPTWSFRFDDVPVGIYQVQLFPIMKNWMIELLPGGREDVELVIARLAEVLVETVDAQSGERVPLDVIRYGDRENLKDRVHHGWSGERAIVPFEDVPGRFRIWSAPGPAFIGTHTIPDTLNFAGNSEDLDLVAGFQSFRLELEAPCVIHFEFRIDGGALPREDAIFVGLGKTIHAVNHEGRAAPVSYDQVRVSGPGVYEITFEGIGGDRFLPIPPQRIDMPLGETKKVIVDLIRK